MSSAFSVKFDATRAAMAVYLSQLRDLRMGLDSVGLKRPRPVVVVIGGAGGMPRCDVDRLREMFVAHLVPVLDRTGAAGVDGGTQAGVMRAFGEARARARASFPLVGVVAAGTVLVPGSDEARTDLGQLEPNHTHFLLVPGQAWGDETAWIARAATVLAAGSPTVTVIINGGEIAYSDVRHSVAAARLVVTVAGSGRTADELAEAVEGMATDPRAVALAATRMVRSVPWDDLSVLSDVLAEVLRGSTPSDRPVAGL